MGGKPSSKSNNFPESFDVSSRNLQFAIYKFHHKELQNSTENLFLRPVIIRAKILVQLGDC